MVRLETTSYIVLFVASVYLTQLLHVIAIGNKLQHVPMAQVQFNSLRPPVVINTWNFTHANKAAWFKLSQAGSALDAVEAGCRQCQEERCDGTVGWGGSPSETGETTLDAMIMDGNTYNVGAVGGLRRVKDAIGVARMVLEKTNHSLLVGDMATKFALEMGFIEESLTSEQSKKIYKDWLKNSCQPNFWINVSPDPRKFCGPYREYETTYTPLNKPKNASYKRAKGRINAKGSQLDSISHDTIGMIAWDSKGNFASATSTNGLRHKILGRVGDSPIAGAGSYAAKEAGAAAATGDGDVIMRHLLSYQAVESLRQGMNAEGAANDAIGRLVARSSKPTPHAAVIVLSKNGDFGAACSGYSRFPFVVSDAREVVVTKEVTCVG